MKIKYAIKHFFIPHIDNDYKPHIFREVAVSVILFGSVFLLGSSFGTTMFMRKTVLGVQMSSGVLIDLTNENRLADNQPALVRNDRLDRAASLKANDMIAKQYFSHDSPDGVTPWYWFRKVGYKFLYAGENLAINFTEAGDVEEAWMKSPLHRANIMNVQFREIGLAVEEGQYEGHPTLYVVQLFGTPAYGATMSENKGDASLVKVTKPTETVTTVEVSTTTKGEVKGEQLVAEKKSLTSSQIATSTSKTATTSTLEKVIATPEIAIVKDTSASSSSSATTIVVTYSSWYHRVLFNIAHYIDIIYKILASIIALALLVMIFVEIRKQHIMHIIYGVSLLLILLSFMYINTFFLN